MEPQKQNNNRPRRRPGNNQRPPRGGGGQRPNQGAPLQAMSTSRGQAVRAQKRSQMDAQRIANQFLPASQQTGSQPRERLLTQDPRID